jgi:hypothetical protein
MQGGQSGIRLAGCVVGEQRREAKGARHATPSPSYSFASGQPLALADRKAFSPGTTASCL